MVTCILSLYSTGSEVSREIVVCFFDLEYFLAQLISKNNASRNNYFNIVLGF